ncbi:cytochrome P450 [Inquilinus sp. OTU3971]|uniref:cytochrome P450 n=1 Tax=Inquilinus sp. OTU3971 TaxID=3043855 RepID=UPI00313BA294
MDRPLREVPAAPGRLPILGHGLALAHAPLRFLESLRISGEIVRIDVGAWPVYMLTSPGLVHEALVAYAPYLVRGRIYNRARPLFGNGLAVSDGELHKQQRRLVQPAFRPQRIAAYADIMSRRASELTRSWRAGQQVAFDRAMHELTLQVVVSALFSAEIDRSVSAELLRLMRVIMQGIALRAVLPRRLDSWPLPVNRRFTAAATRLRQMVDEIIMAGRGQNRGDLLSLLLAAHEADGGAIPVSQIRDEAISLLVAGTETPATTLAWTFHELSRRPEIERRLHAEIDTVVGDGPIGIAELEKLEYTQRVLMEVLRLYPVLMFTRRTIAEIALDGVCIPSGTEIAYSPYALNRDPDLYPDPTGFDPDRWLPERDAHLPPRTFTPFGSGHHRCIGEAFAWTEMSILVATITRRWRLRPADERPVRKVVAEVPRPDALPMVLESRRR